MFPSGPLPVAACTYIVVKPYLVLGSISIIPLVPTLLFDLEGPCPASFIGSIAGRVSSFDERGNEDRRGEDVALHAILRKVVYPVMTSKSLAAFVRTL